MTNIKSALVSGLIMGLLGVAGYVIGIGDIFKLNAHVLINVGVMSALTTIVSLVKTSLTNTDGKIAGVQIK